MAVTTARVDTGRTMLAIGTRAEGLVPLPEVAARLNDRIEDLARDLLGPPNRSLSSQTQLRYGTKGSLAVEIAGPEAGRWYDHEHGVGGDALELVRHHHGMTSGEACDWGRGWLGLETTRLPARHADAKPAETELAEKVAAIVGQCGDIAGTPVERYLQRRGIVMAPPPAIRFRPHAARQFGALVALATDAEGAVLAVQQVYLTEDGSKAPVAVVKRTNKAVEGWSSTAAVRLPGTEPLVLCEGVETALSIWQATGRETWACLGIANIGRAPAPEGTAVVLARDGDEPGSKADDQIMKAARNLAGRRLTVTIACPPEGMDFNDALVKEGTQAVCEAIDGATPLAGDIVAGGSKGLLIGSDVEIANRVRDDLVARHGGIVHAEGAFWRFAGTHWETIPEHELRLAVHAYDGAPYVNPNDQPARVKLSKGRVDSALHECASLCADPGFFESRPAGINSASGFIRIAADGTVSIEPHDREHRCRHTLPGHWCQAAPRSLPEGSLLARLLGGVFRGDGEAEEKVALLSEVCGSAALGYVTQLIQPRAIILYGQTAENGKSQVLDLARGLLPRSAICSVPAARMGDERHIIGLVGKLLNATDELSAAAVASETFKSVVTGEPIEGRDVYKSRIEFRPVAQNLFATNSLPAFQGGLDRGVQRRLLVVPFSRTIPMEERIEHIGRRIAQEEADLLLAWAVEGAVRLVRQRNFTQPASCRQALADWIFGADPVLAWLDECTETRPVHDGFPALRTRSAYEQFRAWATEEGFKPDKLPAINGFVQRVQANAPGVEHKRTGDGRLFLGLVVVRHTSSIRT